MKLLIDTREPWPHPWRVHFPADIEPVREGLETGDIALACNPGVVVERKTVSDFLGSITAGRERFEAELKRGRRLDFMAVVVEGTMLDCLDDRGGMSAESLLGTVAAISRRYCPVLFAGTSGMAARLALRILRQPVDEANRLVKAAGRVEKVKG
jgi:ERCC4-type nuclease